MCDISSVLHLLYSPLLALPAPHLLCRRKVYCFKENLNKRKNVGVCSLFPGLFYACTVSEREESCAVWWSFSKLTNLVIWPLSLWSCLMHALELTLSKSRTQVASLLATSMFGGDKGIKRYFREKGETEKGKGICKTHKLMVKALEGLSL